MVLICASLMINSVECLFRCLLAVCISSLEVFCPHLENDRMCLSIFGCPGSSLLRGLSLAVAIGGYSPVAVLDLLTVVASLLAEHGSRICGPQQVPHMGLALEAPELWSMAQSLWATGLLECASPALTSGFFTAELPGTPLTFFFSLMIF